MKADIGWLDNPEVFRVNRLDAHSDHNFYQDPEDMGRECNSLLQPLNGIWKFRYSQNAGQRPVDFFEPGYDAGDFDEIAVPCHIEMAGYDKIHYINTMYPWEGHYYRRPAYSLESAGDGAGMFSGAPYNPVGSYRREFDLEQGLVGKRVVIRFEGVEQAMYVWLNGSFVGYAEDSFSTSEFDLTPYIKEKGNVLAVEVHKRSTAAFLEDQDFFRFFGIYRNVTLYAKPRMHVEDLWARTELNEDGTGSLSLDLTVSMKEKAVGRAEISLENEEGKELLFYNMHLPGELKESVWQAAQMPEELSGFVQAKEAMKRRGVGEVTSWDHHHPCLYRLVIRLYDEAEELVETVPYRIGFRRIEIADKVMLLNGKRLILNGVNRHEWSAEGGRCIGSDHMKADMEIFRRNHINAVRTCHYPDQIPWYYLCDENGIYMMSETNLESHGSWQKMDRVEPSWNVPGNLLQWREAVLDRARNNFETFKNHVSVLFWSLGNESYVGDDIQAMNAYFKSKKDGRLVHYEGVVHNRKYEDAVSDMESRMYASPQQVREYLEDNPKKPFILCEYMHDMGNSLGGMASYMKLLDEFPMYQGGFIWDYIDKAVLVKDEVTGRDVLRYGGDFDDRPSDYEFSGNGIVFADRTEKPAMQEVRYYYGLYR